MSAEELKKKDMNPARRYARFRIAFTSFLQRNKYDHRPQIPGGSLTCPWYGLCHFLGYLFHDRVRIYGYGFQQVCAFSGSMGIIFCKNSFIGELFWRFQIYGYDFQKILQIYGYTFEKFLRIYRWYFHDLNGTTPYLGNLSDSPPPGRQILAKPYE